MNNKPFVFLKKSTNLSLDDCYITLKDSIPNLSRSNLHRCLQRNGLSVLPKEVTTPLSANKKQKFKTYKTGYLHLDITEVTLEKNNKFNLFVAIDRISKFAIAKIYKHKTTDNSIDFLKKVIDFFPYQIHRILTDNGSQFTYRLLTQHLRPKAFHPFDLICKQNAIKHKLTKFRHPWTNGQVERFNRTIKNDTVKRYHYDNIEQLEAHLQEFMMAYNFAKKLKAIKFKTPWEFILAEYQNNSKIFKINPFHYSRGLNT